MNIRLHIERLVLDALPVTAREGVQIQNALETELARLLAADGLPGLTGAALNHLSCGQIPLASGSKPAQTGNQIAQAVHSGLASLAATPRMIGSGGWGNT